MAVMSQKTRPAIQAGRFYPSDPKALMDSVEGFLQAACKGSLVSPKAILAPHAGFSYSGPVAGAAFAPWRAEADRIRRVVLLGPSHWVDFRGIALPEAVAMATPLGEIPLDAPGVATALQMPGVVVYDPAHSPEHALEVELPFLQGVLKSFTVVPLIVGRETDSRVQAVIEALWGGDETRFVLSSDLSHYLDYESAKRFDHGTADSILRLAAGELTPRRACGYRPLRGFLEAAAARGFQAAAVDLRNSGDTAGRRDDVVGYGAFHFASGSPASTPATAAA